MDYRLTVFIILGGAALLGIVVETVTVLNKTPDDHITAAFRRMSKTDLGHLILTVTAWVVGVIMGHIWHAW